MVWHRARSALSVLLALLLVLSSAGAVPASSYAARPQAASHRAYLPLLATTPPGSAAVVQVDPGVQYLGDGVGTLFTFSVTNSGQSDKIGVVEISRPSDQWTLIACPQSPAGWSAELSPSTCRYVSAAGPADDLAPGQTVVGFQVKAATLEGTGDRTGSWKIVVMSSRLETPFPVIAPPVSVQPRTLTAYAWEILDAVVDAAPSAPGSPCPAPNRQAVAGSSARTVVICGKNHMTVAATPQASFSALGGSLIASAATFVSGPVPAGSASSVVLGTWSDVTISPSAGAGLTVSVGLGSAPDQTAPLVELGGYQTSNPPVAGDDTYTTGEDTALAVAAPGVLANDSAPDGGSLAAVLVSGPSNGSLTFNPDGAFLYTPRADYNGLDSFTYRAQSSSGALSSTARVTVDVSAVADAPAASGQSLSLDEGAATPIVLSGGDVDGDSLTFTVVSGPGHGSLSPLGAPSCAAGSCTAGLTYTPGAGYNGPDSFSFKVEDGALASPPATVSLTVNPVDDQPAAVDDSASVAEDGGATALDVLANDLDADGGPQSIAAVTQPAQGVVAITGAGTGLTYQPNADACNTPPGTAPDTFTYTLVPGGSTATVSVTVTCVNDAPVAAGDAYSLSEDGALSQVGPGVLANDVDVDNDPLTAALVGGPAHAAGFALNTDGSFSYTPEADYAGADSFSYRAGDGALASDVVTVTLTVDPLNDPPAADAQTATTDQDKAVTINLGGSDLESCELSFTIVAGPAHGSLGAIAGAACVAGSPGADSASVVYTPASGYNGPDSFTYRVTDAGQGASAALDSAAATVTITIDPPNAAPSVTPATFGVAENSASGTAVGTVAGSDPDAGQSLSFAITGGNTGGAFAIGAGSGQITVANSAALDFEAAPTFSLEVTATDNGAPPASGSATITVNLADVNEQPAGITLSSASVAENQPAGTTVGTLSSADVDAGDTHSYTLAAGAGDDDNGSFTLSAGTLKTGASFDFEARSSYSIRVRSTDGGGLARDQVFAVGVVDANDAPGAIALSSASVAENQPAGATVGTLSSADQDAGDSHSYALVTGAGDGDNALFTLSAGALKTGASFDFETRSSYSIRVQSDDGNGGTFQRSFTLAVADVNEQPASIALSSASVAENQPAGATVGTLSSADVDAGDSHTYTLVAGAGDGDNALFTLSGGTLTTGASFDFEARSSYSIRARSTDSGGLSVEQQLTVTVADVNDAPALADLESGALAYAENDPATALTAALTVSDQDDAALTGATVRIGAGYQSGQDLLAFTSQPGISGSFDPATGVLTLSGDAPLAGYQAALRSVTYVNTSENPSAVTRTISFQVNDGALDSNTVSRPLTVAPVNDAPVNSLPGAQTVNEDSDLVFSTANGNAISVADVDAGANPVKLSLGAAHGVLTLPSTAGLTFVDGTANGQASIHVTGTVAAINAALSGLTYRGDLNYNLTRGAETLTLTTSDLGNSGAGGARSDSDTIGITVGAVNDAPTAQARSFAAQANMQIALGGLLSGAGDPDAGDGGYTPSFSVGAVSVTTPAGGTLSSLDAATGSFSFDPPPGVTGDVTFTYTVCDSGNPGPALCSAPATATVSVSGPVVWFVDDSAPAGGDGRLSGPFNTLAAAAAAGAANQRIFLYSGSYAGGIALSSGQWLVGQGVSGASLDAVTGVTPPAGTVARPGIGGARPTVLGTVTLAGGSIVSGLDISSGAATGLADPAGAISGVTVSEVSVSSTTGTAVDLSDNAGAFAFTAISAGTAAAGPVNGIRLANTAGSFGVLGTGAAGSGGTIQKTSGHGVSLNNATGVSLNTMTISVTAGSGVRGTRVNSFSFTNGLIEYSGFTGTSAPVDATLAGNINISNIAFNDGSSGTPLTTEQNLTGSVTITGNTLSHALFNGVDLYNYAGTISDLSISNNTFTSGTTTGAGGSSFGSAIRVIASGGASNAASVTRATIDSNTITGFPGNAGIQLQGGNQTAAGPGGSFGIAGSGANVVNVTNNRIRGHSPANRMGTQAILFTVGGGNAGSRSQGNVNISNNGTLAEPLAHITGNAISPNALGNATVTAVVANNVLAPNNSLGSQGIGGGTASVIGATDTPMLTVTVTGNSISQTDGNGILLVARGATGTLNARVQSNTVAAPLGGPREGIRLDAGNGVSTNDSVCLNIAGNTSAGSGGTQGIGLRKQGAAPATNAFGVHGMAATSTPGVESYVSGLNPAGGGTGLISAASGFSNCTLP